MPEGKGAAETLYGNKDGESNTVRMKFLANPMPTEGQWNIGEVTVPIGASDLEGNFQSSQIAETGDLTGEYQVELTFTMTKELADKTYSLQVTNGLGTTQYEFKLALSEAPPAGPKIEVPQVLKCASGPVIIIVLVVVALVIVGGVVLVARAKGMMCFGEKAEQLDEEKEAFDDAEKGKLAGETEKSKTPEKKPITAETETKKKKS